MYGKKMKDTGDPFLPYALRPAPYTEILSR